jgi:hypothetical protein
MKSSVIKSFFLLLTVGVFLSGCDERVEKEERAQTAPAQEEEEVSDRIKQEGRELEIKLEALKEKAEEKGEKAGDEIKTSADKLKKEVKDFNFESTEERAEEKWQELKVRINNSIDSLDKKI